jgi:hypothetical protein
MSSSVKFKFKHNASFKPEQGHLTFSAGSALKENRIHVQKPLAWAAIGFPPE